MAKDHVYHWKHGWIPLTHSAAMSKAKGNKEAAGKMLEDAKSPGAGIHSREHVAKAALALHEIHDPKQRSAALADVHAAADKHDAHDVLPKVLQPKGPSAVTQRDAADVKAGDILHVPSAMGGKTKRYHIDKAYAPKSSGDVNVDVTNVETGAKTEMTLPGFKQHHVERPRKH